MQKLHSRAVWLFYGWKGIIVVLFTVPSSTIGILAGPAIGDGDGAVVCLAALVFPIFINVLFFVWNLIVSKMYKFELKERELSIEFGVFDKENINIPFARIQNVNIYRSFWARVLGLSELQIQTAGSSNIEGKIPALGKEDAEKIREDLLSRAGTRHEGI